MKEYTNGLLNMIKRSEEEDEFEEIRGLTK